MKVKNIQFFYSLAGLLLITACAVGQKYKQPEIALPAAYKADFSLTADTLSLPWASFFKDPILVDLIQGALNKNKEISVALLSIQQVNLIYKQARLGNLPTADFALTGSRSYPSKNSLNGSLSEQFTGKTYMDDFNASLAFSWEADIWGKVQMQTEKARADYFMQQQNLDALQTRIITEVAQAYFNLITLDEQLKVAERNIELSENTLQMIRLQYQSALVSSLALEQAEAQKKTAELVVPLARQQMEIQENALSILCGNFPDLVRRGAGFSRDLALQEVFPVGVPANLLSRRPDVKAAEYAVVIAHANAGLAKAALYPTFSVTPSIGANALKFNNWFDLPGSLVKNFAINITQPIFRKHELRTAYEVNQLELQKSAEQFRMALMNAANEVSDALVKAKYAQERLDLVQEKKRALDKATFDADLLYKSGIASYLEVITAQNTSLQNELEEVAIYREKYNALTDLYRSLGGVMN